MGHIFQLIARFNIVLRKELLTFAAGAGGVSFRDCTLRKKETQNAESIFFGVAVVVVVVLLANGHRLKQYTVCFC